jgi:hypothetical protein
MLGDYMGITLSQNGAAQDPRTNVVWTATYNDSSWGSACSGSLNQRAASVVMQPSP